MIVAMPALAAIAVGAIRFHINIYVLCIATFVLAFAACALLTPLVIRAAVRLGHFDEPDGERRVHTQPTPRLGGIAIYLGFTLALFVTLNIALLINTVIARYLDTPDLAKVIGMLFGGTLMMGVGLWDDVMEMRARNKFIAQFVVALIAVLFYGFTIYRLSLPHFGLVELAWFGIPFSLFWYLGMVNAINFLDGLDGLVAGYTTIACVALTIISLVKGQYLVAITTCALAGAAGGFLPYNYSPARIFMGDGGSMFIGFVLATVGVMGTEKNAVAISLVVPLLILALPILDTAKVIARRLHKGAPLAAADRGHVHHQLLDLGLSQRQAVLLIYAVCGILGVVAIALSLPKGSHIF
ncbi:MAG: undecaprenyl/decaprenyl-phosphate alpha-N-acetylglucosaminyl 1-phosphate transferase [Candidatus Eremiobacteraeota bacterium]|nr:undecaprenyl/decaprenyl-phosphate alpha-N-acetylglucosaminyl 1-phosphate transferase [Candidatus Eremiobacteraeota bacterium]